MFVRTVSVELVVAETLTLCGLKVKVMPFALGLTLDERETVPLKPPLGLG